MTKNMYVARTDFTFKLPAEVTFKTTKDLFNPKVEITFPTKKSVFVRKVNCFYV